MSYISQTLRKEVIERAKSCCEYCLVHQEDSLYTHEVDHIIPEKHRGDTVLDNLCLACFECNRFKGSDFGSFDPETDEISQLFNPRTHIWPEHFELQGVEIKALTPIGRVTVFVLKLNELGRLQAREDLLDAENYPPNS